MAVYINNKGRRVLSLTDEEFSDVQWDKRILLELDGQFNKLRVTQ